MSADPHHRDLTSTLPALRAIDIAPVQDGDGDVQFVLHDRLGIAPTAMAVSPAGYFVLAHLDGARSCADVQAAFERYTGMRMPAEQVFKLVDVLDELLLLQGERFEHAYAERRRAYAAAEFRDNRDRYPDADSLRSEIQGILARGVAAPVGRVRGVIVPHLDYARGAPCYADAYATLAASAPAARYVILGTNHGGRASGYVATSKDFQTPLGRVAVDREFVDRLEQQFGADLCEFELDHAAEHSIELQVHFLQVVNEGRQFSIVPILCSNPCAPADETCPNNRESEHVHFAAALRDSLACDPKDTVLIAGADLSHIGQRFGDEGATTPEFLETVARSDQRLLQLVESHQEAAFVAELRANGNPTKICSVGCIYTLLAALPDRRCRVLSYHQAVDYAAETHVTCAAAIVD